MKIFLVRHGETDWNKNGICQGKTNISLNENGIAQAKVLKDKINVNLIDICYVSPLNRTIETAKIITNNKLDLIIDDRIVERGFGTLEGKPFNYDATAKSWDYELNYDEYDIEAIKEVLKRAKGYFGSKHLLYKTAHEQVMHSLHYAYVSRRTIKRDYRKLWIVRINAACRLNDTTYSRLIAGLKKNNIELNRKVLADMATNDPVAFASICDKAKA